MDIATIWAITFGVLLVFLGFNALIFVHEFGHFVVARLCKVRCDKFYLFFDFWGLRIFRCKWGQTEYGLGLFPLGGYVKMLGQEDDPGAIRAEIERAKVQATADGRQQTAADGNSETVESTPAIFAPDSYLSKTVPQRLAIIVAGVIMNFFFAVICAAGAYKVGVTEIVPAVGNVIPGSPAWEAGLQTGDRITAIDGKPAKVFGDILKKMIEGNKIVRLNVDRQGHNDVIDVTPRQRSGDLTSNIGVASLPTLELSTGDKLLHGLVRPTWKQYYSSESLETLETFDVLETLAARKELPSIRIEKVGENVVTNYAEYLDAQLQHIGEPIDYTFSGVTVKVPAIPMREIPVRFKMGEIVSVLPGSAAEKSGIKKGDTILSVDGDADIDPLKLSQVLLRKVNAGQENVELVIKKANGDVQTLTAALAPIRIMPELGVMSMRDPLGSNALGLSWNVEPVIAGVSELEGARQPGIEAGDKVVAVEFVHSSALLGRTSFSKKTKEGGFFSNDRGFLFYEIGNKIDIPFIFSYLLQDAQLSDKKSSWLSALFGEEQPDEEKERTLSVRLTLEGSDGNRKEVDLPILESTDWFNLERGYFLKAEQATITAAGLGDALSRGTVRTLDYGLLVYRTLKALLSGAVSPKALNGPVGIVEIMYKISQSGWSEYLMLLCLIGINLAVINLLPIPPLDGGHVVFLLYEGIFRRPPNEMIQVVLSYLGLFLIILLMVWTVSLDLTCIPRW